MANVFAGTASDSAQYKHTMTFKRFLIAAMVLLTAGGASYGPRASAAPLTVLQADTSFSGMTARGVMPIVVTVANAGPSVDGALVVRSSSYSGSERDYLYPISLPTGAQKRVFVYPNVTQETANITVGFDGPAKFREVTIPVAFAGEGTQQIGLIGDKIGGLSLLRGNNHAGMPGGYVEGTPGGYVDSYARPEDAPDRASGYRSLSTVVLSDGAERMDGAQWSALRQWVVDGGSLMLLGGASGAYLRLPDAQDLVPLTQLRGAALNGVDTPGAGVVPGAVALTTGVPKTGATVLWPQGNTPLLATERLGAGNILFVAYDPLDAPFRGWDKQPTLWTQLIQKAQAPLNANGLSDWATQDASSPEYGAYTPYRRAYGTSSDAFHVQLPPVSSIAWMLLAYFIAVIPVTYLVLKKLRRLEWAWVTSPVLSIAFAYGFYLFTADLYKAGLSRRTSGAITAAAGDSTARFSGETEMFFPRGGDYALVIPDAESLETTNVTENYGSGASTDLQPLETVDTGAVSAPHYGATNLNFKRIYYTQPISWGTGIGAEAHRDAKGEVSGRITNQTDLPLRSVSIVFPGTRRYASLPDLPPGKSSAFAMAPAVAYTSGDLTDWQMLVRNLPTSIPENTALLLAQTDGTEFGPRLGRDVGRAGSVRVVVSLPIR